MFFAPVAYGRFFNLLAAIIASISNSVVLIVPSPVFSRCHQLQVFDSVVIFDVVAMVNHITFGHVAEVKPPNRLVERNCAEEMPFFGLVENLPVEFNMRLIEDFDFRRCRNFFQRVEFVPQSFIFRQKPLFRFRHKKSPPIDFARGNV